MEGLSISLKSLVSQCVDLAQRAGAHIRVVSDKESEIEGSLGTHDKGLGTGNFDPQTIADRQAQRCIVENLRAVYGMALRIVGEEGELGVEEGEGNEIIIKAPQEDLLDDEWPEEVKLPLCELCVWVDPLDGTKEFTEGRYEYVSTLIGISYQGHPVAGIISEPYRQDKYGQLGRILWGCCQDTSRGVPGVHVFGDSEWQRPRRPKGRCLTLVSRSRASGEVADALQRLSEPGTAPIDAEAYEVMPTGPVNETSSPVQLSDAPLITGTQQAGGAGHKVARVVDGEADLWLFPRAGTSRWDSCAAEAMLEACGGALRNRYGEQIFYDPDGAMGNTEGVLAAASMGILSAAVRVCNSLDVARSLEGQPLSRQWLEMALGPSSEVEAFSVMSCQRSDETSILRLLLRYGMLAKDVLPNTLIFKSASKKCKESMFFSTCASRFCEGGLRLPHIYFNDSRELEAPMSKAASVLLMEDVMAKPCRSATSLEDLKLSMAAVARMHFMTFEDDDVLGMWEHTSLPASPNPSKSEVLESWQEMIKTAAERPEGAEIFLVEAGIPDLISRLVDVGGASLGDKPKAKVGRCLIHGNLRRDNIIIDVNTCEVIPINFSYARVDVPAFDIAYFLSSSPKFFASFDELLDVYYQTFANLAGDSKKSLPVASFHQNVKSFCLELALRPHFTNFDLEEIEGWVNFLKFVLAEMDDV